uniref:39S ribosomal protein L46, mitochondrial-like n=1 Tax=Styela clava TaxID=7725 RepID=UPI00193A4EF3|nr:39S ribosomal protein L46, mitochondrial-like [Styela clava]
MAPDIKPPPLHIMLNALGEYALVTSDYPARFRCLNHSGDELLGLRKIWDSITYVVKKKLGNHELWVLPSAPVDDKETMRQCAERSLSLHSLGHYKGTILSNAPSGYFKYKFPKEVRLKNCGIGAKVFIYSALLKDINIFNSKQLEHVMVGSQEDRL